MTEMLSLFDFADIDADAPDRELTLKERWAIFHAANPQVYAELVKRTEVLRARGRTRFGIAMLFETLRWDYYMTTSDPTSEFKLNNSYRSFYARLLMDEHPEWGPIFELRASVDDGAHLVRRSDAG